LLDRFGWIVGEEQTPIRLGLQVFQEIPRRVGCQYANVFFPVCGRGVGCRFRRKVFLNPPVPVVDRSTDRVWLVFLHVVNPVTDVANLDILGAFLPVVGGFRRPVLRISKATEFRSSQATRCSR